MKSPQVPHGKMSRIPGIARKEKILEAKNEFSSGLMTNYFTYTFF